MNNKPLGRVLCKGSGLKVYGEIKLHREIQGQEKEYKVFRYALGSLQKILAESNRQTQFNYVAGRKTPAGTLKGIRSTFGEIVFEFMDTGVLYNLFNDVHKFNKETKQLEAASLDGFSFEDYTLMETDAALMGHASEISNVDLYKNQVTSLDDLPPIDIIVTGYADQIDPTTGKYEVGNTYQFRLRRVVFLSETFGISPGEPLHNVATKVIILGGVEPWSKVVEKHEAGAIARGDGE